MGTPEFAIPTLQTLIKSKHKILSVYTRTPKKAGRGQKLQKTPIHKLASKNNLQIFTPKSLKNPDEQNKLKQLNPDIIVVVAYGLILPKQVLDIPKFGCINIHPSLLPKWRGAAPMQRSLLAGDKKTGICIMKLSEGLDDGDILTSKEIDIKEDTDIKYLHDNLAKIGAKLLLQTLNKIEKTQKIKGKKQNNSLATYAHKIKKSEGKINWSKTADEINRQIRALWAFPGVYFEYKNERIKILKAQKISGKFDKPGTILDKNLTISCKNGAIQPLILQRAGKKPMKIEEFLRGFKIEKETKLK